MNPALTSLNVTAPVLLAPMAGITDLPFRRIALRYGAGLVVSEMVASREMVEARRGSPARAALGLGAAATSVQLAGREAHWMAEAARMLEDGGARIIDINMGCPAKKVTGGLSGSALMRAPDHALRLIAAVVGAVGVPVTLKMRLGWDDDQRNAAQIARRAEAAGVRMIAVHGRTRCQFYRGRADWAAIREVSRAVGIPVVVNGDIRSGAEARAALAASGAAAVMVGRGARGRPWLLGQIAADLATGAVPLHPAPSRGDAAPPALAPSCEKGLPPGAAGPLPVARAVERDGRQSSDARRGTVGRGAHTPPAVPDRPEEPIGAALAELAAEHVEASCAFYGADLGARTIRKHLGWYMDAAGTPPDLRRRVLTAPGPREMVALLHDALAVRRDAA